MTAHEVPLFGPLKAAPASRENYVSHSHALTAPKATAIVSHVRLC
jgi:hypothetical protein